MGRSEEESFKRREVQNTPVFDGTEAPREEVLLEAIGFLVLGNCAAGDVVPIPERTHTGSGREAVTGHTGGPRERTLFHARLSAHV